MTKNEEAASLINNAITLLLTSRDNLIAVRSEHRFSLSVPIANLLVLHDILIESEGADPE